MAEKISYNWKPEEIFQLEGKELEVLLNFCNFKLSQPEAQEAVAVYELKRMLDKKITEGVDSGKVKVVKQESPN